jgi:hypothetical protein
MLMRMGPLAPAASSTGTVDAFVSSLNPGPSLFD